MRLLRNGAKVHIISLNKWLVQMLSVMAMGVCLCARLEREWNSFMSLIVRKESFGLEFYFCSPSLTLYLCLSRSLSLSISFSIPALSYRTVHGVCKNKIFSLPPPVCLEIRHSPSLNPYHHHHRFVYSKIKLQL